MDLDAPEESNANLGPKRVKFRRLAENRATRAIDAILRIGNLANRNVYDFNEAEVRKLIQALRDAVSVVENRFQSPKGGSTGFKF